MNICTRAKDLARPFYWRVNAWYRQPKHGMFTSTNIETYGHCNRACDFCFNSDRFPDRGPGIMPLETWEKIINDLSALGFAGRISPHHYGEPLLDKRLPELLSMARKACPDAELHFSSNGDLLTEALLLKLLDHGLDSILVTNYDDFERPLLTGLHEKYPDHVRYRQSRDMWFQNKAGVQLDRVSSHARMPCLRPSRQLVVNWKGNVVLCCNDYYENHVFGNVMDASLLEIWNSDEFRRYRRLLGKGYRAEIDICANCDTS